jgi:hypothetical protein
MPFLSLPPVVSPKDTDARVFFDLAARSFAHVARRSFADFAKARLGALQRGDGPFATSRDHVRFFIGRSRRFV